MLYHLREKRNQPSVSYEPIFVLSSHLFRCQPSSIGVSYTRRHTYVQRYCLLSVVLYCRCQQSWRKQCDTDRQMDSSSKSGRPQIRIPRGGASIAPHHHCTRERNKLMINGSWICFDPLSLHACRFAQQHLRWAIPRPGQVSAFSRISY